MVKSTAPKVVKAKPAQSSAVKPVPDGAQTVMPHLVCAGAADAIAFYEKAFGAKETFRLDGADGKVMHACIVIGNAPIFLVDEYPEWDSLGPLARKGTSVTLHLTVSDADAAAAKAVAAGATLTMPVADMFWGDRYGIVTDPFGHRWSIAHKIKTMTPEEIAAAMPKTADC
ncbi:MAG TPA: VOC family protein [Hyphomicrobium sp.]|nr:VOC family protein [Hyphomicrobium sp.]